MSLLSRCLIYMPLSTTWTRIPRLRIFSIPLHFVSPLQALSQDQLRTLLPLLSALDSLCSEPIVAGVYDGDTPTNERFRLRQQARLLETNPDMLHVSILQNHAIFKRYLSNLR